MSTLALSGDATLIAILFFGLLLVIAVQIIKTAIHLLFQGVAVAGLAFGLLYLFYLAASN